MASKNYFLNGVAELLILSILKKNDTYIYDIKKIISEISNNTLPMSQNTIYAAAYKLENENKITEYPKLVGKNGPESIIISKMPEWSIQKNLHLIIRWLPPTLEIF